VTERDTKTNKQIKIKTGFVLGGMDVLELEGGCWWRQFAPLARIDDEVWADAVGDAEIIVAPAGYPLFYAGDRCRRFTILLEGTVRVCATGRRGREMVLYRMHAGQACVLTLTSLMLGGTYPVSAVTERPVRGAALRLDVFRRLLDHSPGFRQYVLECLADQFHQALCQAQELAFDPLDVRLAGLLYRRFQEENQLRIEITHNQLAQELGTTREVASRMLKGLERRQLLRLHRGSIELNNTQALEYLSQKGGELLT